jgi:hypothetical protein
MRRFFVRRFFVRRFFTRWFSMQSLRQFVGSARRQEMVL